MLHTIPLRLRKEAKNLASDHKDRREKCENEGHFAPRNAVIGEEPLPIAPNPGHGNGEDAEEDHGANPPCKTKGFEKNGGVEKGEDQGRHEGKKKDVPAPLLGGGNLQPVAKKVHEGKSLSQE